jgi:hypothetical protein
MPVLDTSAITKQVETAIQNAVGTSIRQLNEELAKQQEHQDRQQEQQRIDELERERKDQVEQQRRQQLEHVEPGEQVDSVGWGCGDGRGSLFQKEERPSGLPWRCEADFVAKDMPAKGASSTVESTPVSPQLEDSGLTRELNEPDKVAMEVSSTVVSTQVSSQLKDSGLAGELDESKTQVKVVTSGDQNFIQLEEYRSKAKAEMGKLKKRIVELEEVRDKLMSQVATESEESMETYAEMMEMQGELEREKERNNGLEEEVARLTKQLKDYHSKVKAEMGELKERIAGLEDVKGKLISLVSTEDEEAMKTEQELKERKSELEREKERNKDLEEDVVSLMKQLEEYHSEAGTGELKERIVELEDVRDQLNLTLLESLEQVAHESEMGKLKERIVELEEVRDKLNLKLLENLQQKSQSDGTTFRIPTVNGGYKDLEVAHHREVLWVERNRAHDIRFNHMQCQIDLLL